MEGVQAAGVTLKSTRKIKKPLSAPEATRLVQLLAKVWAKFRALMWLLIPVEKLSGQKSYGKHIVLTKADNF